MSTVLRWGILSTARINRSIIPALRSLPGHELTSVASRNRDAGQRYAREWEIPRVFGSYGFAMEYSVQRYFRDARFLLSGGGTSELLRGLIAKGLNRDRRR